MIRKYNSNDLDLVIEIWLEASVKAHNFVSADFWESQVESMRNIYIPASEVFVYEIESKIVGFMRCMKITWPLYSCFLHFRVKVSVSNC